ncbi:MAG TPA: glycosyltransferase, partial [Dongiaceae bacterium]|nr:glycosyltransferase [Dongiaceae bacterium]
SETLIKGMAWLPGKTLHLLSRIHEKRKKQLEALIPHGTTVIFHNGVTDDEYEKLLADNAILATGSLDEGYGIPVAEAMAMGVPAVISDIPVFHEVGDDGALYFDPHNPKDFATKVKKLDDKAFRDKQITRGERHIRQFSWDESAKTLYTAISHLFH